MKSLLSLEVTRDESSSSRKISSIEKSKIKCYKTFDSGTAGGEVINVYTLVESKTSSDVSLWTKDIARGAEVTELPRERALILITRNITNNGISNEVVNEQNVKSIQIKERERKIEVLKESLQDVRLKVVRAGQMGALLNTLNTEFDKTVGNLNREIEELKQENKKESGISDSLFNKNTTFDDLVLVLQKIKNKDVQGFDYILIEAEGSTDKSPTLSMAIPEDTQVIKLNNSDLIKKFYTYIDKANTSELESFLSINNNKENIWTSPTISILRPLL